MAAQGDIISRLTKLVDPNDLAALMGNPEALLEGLDVPDDTKATRELNAAIAALRAVIDAVAFSVTQQLFGPSSLLHEAYRRHRMADARGEDAAAALFGISLHGEHHQVADEFVEEIARAENLSAFTALLRADGLPSAVELAQPAAWLERVRSSPLA
jgi:uncharacterized protein (DUF2342 family)